MAQILCLNNEINLNSIPNLQNGEVGAITIPVRAAAIHAQYHWVPVHGVVGAAAVQCIRAYIRTYYGVIGHAAVIAENLGRAAPQRLNVANGNAAAQAGSVAYVATLADVRKRAICIGAVRAGLVAMWGVTQDVIAPAEYVADHVLAFANGAVTTVNLANNAAQTLREALALGMTPLTPEEDDIVFALLKVSMGVLPLVGSSLLATGHHYLSSDTVATDAVFKQVLMSSKDHVKAWFTADALVVKDMVWHKAAHPVGYAHAIAQALSNEVPERLRSAQMGSAAVRLPFVESEVKAARAMVAIVAAVQLPVANGAGVLEVPNLIEAIRRVSLYAIAADPVPISLIPLMPNILTRALAVKDVLRPAMENAAVTVGYAIGVYKSMMANIGRGNRMATLMNAHSLQRIERNQMPMVAAGSSFYDNLMRRERNQALAGEIVGPNLTA